MKTCKPDDRKINNKKKKRKKNKISVRTVRHKKGEKGTDSFFLFYNCIIPGVVQGLYIVFDFNYRF